MLHILRATINHILVLMVGAVARVLGDSVSRTNERNSVKYHLCSWTLFLVCLRVRD